jgi:hypothetical protein
MISNEIMESSKSSSFKDTIDKISEYYNSSSFYKQSNNNRIIIGPEEFGLLSKFEKSTLKTIANIWGMLSDPTKEVSYTDLVHIMKKLSEGKTDIEKSYLLSLFFPEKVKNIHTIYPFPIPTYSYSQKVQFFVVPNNQGCFLAQVVCPILLDNSLGNANASNLYVNNNNALNGTTLGLAAHFTPMTNTQTVQGAFTTYVLQACKLSARYVGRGDAMSGYFGGSYNLSSANSRTPDVAPTQFDFVDDSINSVVADVTEGLNVVYYPPDYSYTHFLRVNNDNVANGQMSTSHRMNIYGNSLPTPNIAGGSAGVVLTFVSVWNVIPTPQFADLLPLDYNVTEQSLDLLDISKFVPKAGLTAYKNNESDKIERMLRLPKTTLDRGMQEYINTPMDRRGRNIFQVLDPVVTDNIEMPIYISRSFLEEFGSATKERKRGVEAMGQALSMR